MLDAGGLQKAWAADMVGGSEQGVAERARWGELGAAKVFEP